MTVSSALPKAPGRSVRAREPGQGSAPVGAARGTPLAAEVGAQRRTQSIERLRRYHPASGGRRSSSFSYPALAGSWQVAALLIILERVGKATRNPPRDAMLSHAAEDIGCGWGFGMHEAFDQFAALSGPLLVALIVAVSHHDYKIAFISLAVPPAITLTLVLAARLLYPRPRDLAAGPSQKSAGGGACPPTSR